MKVIWERQETGRRGRLVLYELIALLVDGHYSESDETRPVLARLGSIQEQFLRIPVRRTRAFAQGIFWVGVDKTLERLALDRQTHLALEDQISEKVPRPGEDWALWGVTCNARIDC